jgi:HPt (histidine-containing phosphotransfer) domain-containing protein
MAVGMDDYLAKPVTLDKLRDKVAKWLGGTEMPEVTSTSLVRQSTQAIDPIALGELLGEDDFVARASLLSVFLGDFPDALQRLHAALLAQDRLELKRAAHAAKSAAGSTAAKTLAAVLLKLEHAALEKDFELLSQMEMEAIEEFVRVEMEAKELISSADTNASSILLSPRQSLEYQL